MRKRKTKTHYKLVTKMVVERARGISICLLIYECIPKAILMDICTGLVFQ